MVHSTHNTRMSDSSHYDMVCTDCGATDGAGHEHLWEGPCGMPEMDESWFKDAIKMPGRLMGSITALRRVFDKKTLYELCWKAQPYSETWLDFGAIIGNITYKRGWYFRAGIEDCRMWIQIGVTADAEIAYDPIAKEVVPWRGAKHYLSPYMCRQEVVGTVHHAIQRAEMHELNEWFRYRGRSIYNPHLDPDKLAEFASKKENFNTRDNAMTMDEPS